MATLKLVPAVGPHIEIVGDKAVVGRDPTCDVVVNDVSVSRKHARLERWGGNWAVVDQKSGNGTFLDGERVPESVLRAGQELRFGAVAYRVEIEEETTGATVLMSMPTDRTVLTPSGIAPRSPAPVAAPPAARPAAPPPRSAPPPPAAPPSISPAPRPHAPEPSPMPYTPPPPPQPEGKGPMFWGALGCGALVLLGLVGFGVVMGIPYLKSKGAVDAVSAQLKEIASGDLAAAYARTCASYQAAHTAAGFAAFVERHPGLKGNTGVSFKSRSVDNDGAKLAGSLTHPAGTESVAYNLVKEGDDWRISSIDVEGDEGAVASVEGSGSMSIDVIALNKVPQGQTVTVKIDVRVAGFDLRPEGNLFRVDLAEDLETFGPDGKRIDELSRVGLQNFNQTTASAKDATATFNTSLTFTSPDPGRYKAAITIRDTVGNKSKKREIPFDLP